MNITIYKAPTRREEWFMTALLKGFGRFSGVSTTVVPNSDRVVPPGTDLAVFIGAKSRALRDMCVAAGVPYLLIDKGYFRRGQYHRFCLNGFTPCYLGSGLADPARLKGLDVKYVDRRLASASNVAFVGFDNKYSFFHGLGDADVYTANITTKIKFITEGTPFKLYMRNRAERTKLSFNALLPSCHCVVTHGSIAGVEAVLAGVPVVSLGGRAANVVHDLSSDTLESVVNPKQPDPASVAERIAELAWCQFTVEEIEKGFAWSVLSEQYKRL